MRCQSVERWNFSFFDQGVGLETGQIGRRTMGDAGRVADSAVSDGWRFGKVMSRGFLVCSIRILY